MSDKYKTNLKIIGVKKVFWRDLYFSLMNTSWKSVFFIFFAIYLFFNFIFAVLFASIPGSFNGGDSLFNALSFSVQTFSTIGYGSLLPVSKTGNILVMLESTVGLIFTSVSTGVVFTKLARPIAKIRFSKKMLIKEVDGKKSLVCRLGNMRSNEITEAVVHMTALIDHVTQEGERVRRIVDIPLVREVSPFFRYTWTVQHIIDEKSPFYGDRKKSKIISIIVNIRGFDSIYSNKVSDRYEYLPADILEHYRFQDIVSNNIQGETEINYSKFDDILDT